MKCGVFNSSQSSGYGGSHHRLNEKGEDAVQHHAHQDHTEGDEGGCDEHVDGMVVGLRELAGPHLSRRLHALLDVAVERAKLEEQDSLFGW